MARQQGFSYVIAMFLVAILTVLSVRAIENTLMRERRDKEKELLVVGQTYTNAIRAYYLNTPGFAKHYPPDLQSLLQDPRTTRLSRPLRKLYRDPITGSQEWGLIESPDGGLMGVYSLSLRQPVKVDGFPSEMAEFVKATKYQDWKFVYEPS